MPKSVRFTICPMCLRNRQLYRKSQVGTPMSPDGMFHYSGHDLETTAFFRWAISRGHPKVGPSGFETIKELSYAEAVDLAEDERLGPSVVEVYQRAREIVALFEKVWGKGGSNLRLHKED